MAKKRKKKKAKSKSVAAKPVNSKSSQPVVMPEKKTDKRISSMLIAQAMCRALLAKDELRRQKDVIKRVIFIQQFWKAHKEKQQQAATVVLQNMWRCRLARRELSSLREEADRAKKELVSKISKKMKKLVEIEKRRKGFSKIARKGLNNLTKEDHVERRWFYSPAANIVGLKEELQSLREELHRIDPTDREWDDLMHEAVPPKQQSSAFWRSCLLLKNTAAQAVSVVASALGGS